MIKLCSHRTNCIPTNLIPQVLEMARAESSRLDGASGAKGPESIPEELFRDCLQTVGF